MKEAMKRLKAAAVRFWKSEDGNLRDLTWEVGIGMVIVAVIVFLLTLAPDTVGNIWTRFVNYVTSSFGF